MAIVGEPGYIEVSSEWSGTIPANSTVTVGDIIWKKARKMWLRVRGEYNSSATAGITIRIYLFETTNYIDTEPFIEINPTFRAGETVQETVCYDIPIHHNARIKIINNDSTYDVNVTLNVWFDPYDYSLLTQDIVCKWQTVS